MREKAKKLIKANPEQQKSLFDQLKKIGLDVNSISDVLALEIKDYLERRLQTIVFRKKMSNTVKSARQMITHKKILIEGKVVNKPSYIVPVKLENAITIKKRKKKAKKPEVVEETSEVKEEGTNQDE
jgi:small subunit ribosomal protein S4